MNAKTKPRSDRKLAPTVSMVLLACAMFLAMFAILSAAITPDRYDIKIGQPAPNTIKATKDVEDTLTTEKLRSDAEATVRSVYYVDESVKETVMDLLSAKMEALRQVSSLAIQQGGERDVTESQLSSANTILYPLEITAAQLNALAGAEEDTLTALLNEAQGMVEKALDDNLRDTQTEACVASIAETLLSREYDETLVSVVEQLLTCCIQPNYFYDEEATERARQAERAKVETVFRIKGEVIVSDGEIVTEAQYRMLDSLGIIKESSIDVSLYYGVAILVLLLILSVYFYLTLFAPESAMSAKMLLLCSIICLIQVGACLLAREVNPYFMPSTLGILLISQLVSRRVSVFFNIVMAVAVSLFAGASSSGFFNMAMFTVFVNTLISGNVTLMVLRKRQLRTTNLIAGIAIGVTNMISTFAIGLINNANLKNVLAMVEWAGLSGVLAAVLCIALIPFFEWLFNLVTPTKLIELSNPNQPLLRRLMLEAPGTYHHSIIVANLAEAAASEVGANALLARVGAYYHDVGKLKRPSYFKENQLGDNPHDRTDPRVSTAILTAHPRDGVTLARSEHLPEAIIDIIRSHHGDQPVLYFYNKSVQENGDEVKVDDFRYEGPRPASREAAIVMMADTVEAAVRSLQNPDAEKIRALIDRLIRQKIEDGQFDDCKLSMRDIHTACNSFLRVLSGVFHERIEYPSIEIPKKQVQAAIQEAPAPEKGETK